MEQEGWENSTQFDAGLSQAATRLVLKLTKVREIAPSYAQKQGLTYREIEQLVPDYLPDNIFRKIKDFQVEFREGDCLSFDDVEQLIEEGAICASNCSKDVVGDFRRGKKAINKFAFKVFCRILALEWKEIVSDYSSEDDLELEQKIDLALGQLNHQQQWQKIQPFCQPACHAFLLYLKEKNITQTRLRWLLKALACNINRENPEGLIVTVKPSLGKTRYGSDDIESIYKQIIKKLKERTPEINKAKPTPKKLARAIITHLKKEHLVVVFEDLENYDLQYINSLRQYLCKPILDAVKENQSKIINRGLFFCFCASQGNPTWRSELEEQGEIVVIQEFDDKGKPILPIELDSWHSLMPLEIAVASQFDSEDLSRWLTQIENIKEIKDKIYNFKKQYKQIWNNSDNGTPEKLVEQIYREFGLNWEECGIKWQNLSAS
ncbi:MAG: hypothetical protein SAJ72_19220 [Jaaginema sp. PMC 1080.18]|nr:hypothetical protein [Jaaginema sp. PMC 1080.18]MEC4867645.1 hypothetical protein [Jaaginema sp. PMC 1078.18]